MTEPNWAQVLAVVYGEEDTLTVPESGDPLAKDHKLVQETALSRQEAAGSIDYLNSMRLVDLRHIDEEGNRMPVNGDPSGYNLRRLRLTSKGFDVAHDRQRGLREEAGSTAVAYLTGVLAFTAITQSAIAYTNVSGDLQTAAAGILIILVTVLSAVAWYQMYQAGILDFSSLRDRRRRLRGD